MKIIGTLAASALIGMAVVWFATQPGVGVSPDSTVYLFAAKSFAEGHGLLQPTWQGTVEPLSNYPPLFPTAVGGLARTLGIDVVQSARILNTLTFGANIFILGLVIRSRDPSSFWRPTLAVLLAVTSVSLLSLHTMAWSEPTFFLFAIPGLDRLANYLDRQRPTALINAALLISIAALTRYAANAMILAGIVMIVLSIRRPLFERVSHAGLFGLVTWLPAIAWKHRAEFVESHREVTAVRNTVPLPSAVPDLAHHYLVVHFVLPTQLRCSINEISKWILPPSVPLALRTVFMVAVIAMLGASARISLKQVHTNETSRGPTESTRLLLELMALYGFFLITELALLGWFVDAAFACIENRLLMPLYLCALIAAVLTVNYDDRVGGLRRAVLRWGVVIFVVFDISTGAVRSAMFALRAHRDGQDYASRQWYSSPLVASMRALAPSTVIYTNAPDAVLFLSGRNSIFIPSALDPRSKNPDPNFDEKLAEMREDLKRPDAVVIYFSKVSRLPRESVLLQEVPLVAMTRTDDGSVYHLAK